MIWSLLDPIRRAVIEGTFEADAARPDYRDLLHVITCACGQRLDACEFWHAVLEAAFGPFDAIPFDRFLYLHGRLAMHLSIPRFVSPLKTEAYRSELAEYRDVLARLYGAVAAVSGATTIIDSSKSAAYGLILKSVQAVRLSTLHLVRDSRAVAYSWTRDTDSSVGKRMLPRPVALSAWRWNRENLTAELLAARSPASLRVRYEDFVRDPKHTFRELNRRLGLPQPMLSEDNTAALATNHVVMGNPLRFQTGSVRIRIDDEWQTKLRPRDRRIATLLTWPLLLRYGYALSQPALR